MNDTNARADCIFGVVSFAVIVLCIWLLQW